MMSKIELGSTPLETVRWLGGTDGVLELIDQTLLPGEMTRIQLQDAESVWEAIKSLRVRGAPAIGIAAAYGVVIGMQHAVDCDRDEFLRRVDDLTSHLASSRPTAVNLSWALDKMKHAAVRSDPTLSSRQLLELLLNQAKQIHDSDRQMCHDIGQIGARLFLDRGHASLLTHCNAGGLATAEYGTALSVMFTMQDWGSPPRVFVGETRPLLQGSRLTAWELTHRKLEATLICDSMAGHVMQMGFVDAVITGADRIAANGDTANKIGTYSLAVLARAHGIPFYVAAPRSTFDLSIETGDDIPIEQRGADEITHSYGRRVAASGVSVYNPAFDITPADYIEAIITDRGIIHPVSAKNIGLVLGVT
jgi:methylthioribose-1-phosphate isomerase